MKLFGHLIDMKMPRHNSFQGYFIPDVIVATIIRAATGELLSMCSYESSSTKGALDLCVLKNRYKYAITLIFQGNAKTCGSRFKLQEHTLIRIGM
nr:hypothetical protein [Tanacetum cinerariifolium]